jgi:hypothetical protein
MAALALTATLAACERPAAAKSPSAGEPGMGMAGDGRRDQGEGRSPAAMMRPTILDAGPSMGDVDDGGSNGSR